MSVYIHEHALKHGLSEEDVAFAWDNRIVSQRRKPPDDRVVAIGCDRSGRLVQLIAVEKNFGMMVIHALEPPTLNVLEELGLGRR